MANKELREWRKKTHAIIDPFWQGGRYTRKQLYNKLKKYFGTEVHIAWSDVIFCKEIIKAVNSFS